MKKYIVFVSALWVVLFFLSTAGAMVIDTDPTQDTPMTYTWSAGDLYDLDHGSYYTWGINWTLPQGETIVEAWLEIENIRNYDDSDNDLWLHLLDGAPEGVTVGTDNGGGGDYFAGQGELLYHWKNLSNIAQTIRYDFETDDIVLLIAYLADGNFAFGFDPDCHFYNDGITFTIKTTHAPIPGAFWLLTSGLIGLVGIRQRTGRR